MSCNEDNRCGEDESRRGTINSVFVPFAQSAYTPRGLHELMQKRQSGWTRLRVRTRPTVSCRLLTAPKTRDSRLETRCRNKFAGCASTLARREFCGSLSCMRWYRFVAFADRHFGTNFGCCYQKSDFGFLGRILEFASNVILFVDGSGDLDVAWPQPHSGIRPFVVDDA
ncbi:unnamed protein product [Protopolystoma xenopodis]|uniref:Uncharacterized protein n=1 Tax=Protopolystoma xenopodis TaxID=117903 RepID=A0A3S5ACB8_9PLAT|nr:unnamed protein product [Protopolystoma xenopodis]